jgi:hypothetical protein
MSFGFYDVDDSWEVRDGANVRTINSARLFDVSIVVNPAYSSASVKLAQRSLEKFQAEKEVEQTNFDSVGKRIDLNLRLRLAEQQSHLPALFSSCVRQRSNVGNVVVGKILH